MKRIAAAILAVLLILSASACKNNNGTEPNDDPAINGALENDPEDTFDPADAPDIGSLIQFGGIQWIVLEVQGNMALILSEEILSLRSYHSREGNEYWDITREGIGYHQRPVNWERSEMRQYLNGEFYNSVFSSDEKRRIADTDIISIDNTDKLFLLTESEAFLYFFDLESRIAYMEDGTASWWWLRSLDYNSIAPGVCDIGNVYIYGGDVFDDIGGVRPALWLRL